MPPKPQDYVQQLLRTEEERNRIIAEARQKKQQKIKQARVDAERAVADFRKEKDAELDRMQATLSSSGDVECARGMEETDKQLEGMRKLAGQRMDRVADTLATMICAVDPGK